MTLKKCSYKGCMSIQTPNAKSKETFFKFPKDECRYQLWMNLSRCDNRNDREPKYLCSKHFDHLKYMSISPRRKVLLNNAIPFAYQSDNEEDEEVSAAGTQDVELTQFEQEEFIALDDTIEEDNSSEYISDNHEIVIQLAESSTQNREAQVETIEPSEYDKSQHSDTFEIAPGKSSQKKRKIYENEDSNNIYKVVQINRKVSPPYVKLTQNADLNVEQATISDSEKDNYELDLHEEEEEDLVTNPNVSTFIFKNEEYVQMPKRFYVFEKMELMREIQYYKSIVTNYRRSINKLF